MGDAMFVCGCSRRAGPFTSTVRSRRADPARGYSCKMRYSCETPGPGGYSAPRRKSWQRRLIVPAVWRKPLTCREKVAKRGTHDAMGRCSRKRATKRWAGASSRGGRSGQRMTAADQNDALRDVPPRPAVAPYSFQQLLDRQAEKLGLDLVLHIHVPNASGGTVNVFFGRTVSQCSI
jgi:hypothetical protein